MADTDYTTSTVPSSVHSQTRKICLLLSQLTFPHLALPLSNQVLVLVSTAKYLHFKLTVILKALPHILARVGHWEATKKMLLL